MQPRRRRSRSSLGVLLLNTGAEGNVMTKALTDQAGLTVWTNVRMGIKAVLGGLSKFAESARCRS